MVFRNCLGMIMSVSTLIIGRGAATPVRLVNFCISRISAPALSPGGSGVNTQRQRPSQAPGILCANHQSARHHVVEALLSLGEGDHDEADVSDNPRNDLAEEAAGGAAKADLL